MSAKYDSMKQSYRARAKNDHEDFFPTYHALTRAILPFIENTHIVEPCAGAGDIVKVLEEREDLKVSLASDISPRAQGISQIDFLHLLDIGEDMVVVTNPPFKLSIEFFEKTNELGAKEAWFLWPLDYLHGYARRDRIFNLPVRGNLKLKTCYPFVRRPLFDWKYAPDGKMPTGATSFAWFQFIMDWDLPPTLDWLNVTDFGKPTLVPKVKEFLCSMRDDMHKMGVPTGGMLSARALNMGYKITGNRVDMLAAGEALPTKEEAEILRACLMTTKDYALTKTLLV